MPPHTLAVVLEKDRRPWTAPRWGSLVSGAVVLVAALWLAVDAL